MSSSGTHDKKKKNREEGKREKLMSSLHYSSCMMKGKTEQERENVTAGKNHKQKKCSKTNKNRVITIYGLAWFDDFREREIRV